MNRNSFIKYFCVIVTTLSWLSALSWAFFDIIWWNDPDFGTAREFAIIVFHLIGMFLYGIYTIAIKE